MNIKRMIIIFLVCVISLGNIGSVAGKTHQAASGCFQVLHSDEQTIILELECGDLQ
jgi:hypothetical protein